MLSYRITVPLHDNERIAFPAPVLDDIVKRAASIAGGATFHPEGVGLWIDDDGKTYRDRVRILEVVADYNPTIGRAIGELAKSIARELRQECVALSVSSVSFALVKP